MYTTLWLKYLPVIRILLKKSLKEDQVFLMNIPDFERAGLRRKTGLKFLLKMKNGKPENPVVSVPLAASLATVLQQDDAVAELLMDNSFQFSLNTKYELAISHLSGPEPAAEVSTAAVEESQS
jgi:hypothetical protein